MKKNIKIQFCDFAKSFDPKNNDFVAALRKRYEVEYSDKPDYLIYSTFGYEHLKFDCVRIFFTGECIVPDFNICDYAIGFDELNFGDRYLRYPLYKVFKYKKNLEKALADRSPSEGRGFCSFVCSNDNGMHERKEIYDLLSGYKMVASGGRYMNNVGGPVKSKEEFLSGYKFNIAFENCVQRGYTTEKIVDAFTAGAIPIYYGNPEIGKEFNTRAFINCHDFKDMAAVVEKVKEIDRNDVLYQQMLEEPITNLAMLSTEPLESFLYNIIEQKIAESRRRPCNTYTREHEALQVLMSKIYKYYIFPRKRINGFVRRLKNHSL